MPQCLLGATFSINPLMLLPFFLTFQILGINVKAAALMTKAVVPEMEKRGYRECSGAWVRGPTWTEGGGLHWKRVILFFFQRWLSSDSGLHSSLQCISCKNPFLCYLQPLLFPDLPSTPIQLPYKVYVPFWNHTTESLPTKESLPLPQGTLT